VQQIGQCIVDFLGNVVPCSVITPSFAGAFGGNGGNAGQPGTAARLTQGTIMGAVN
jgi:hypothetical protein